jgi:hypothetical protein
MLVRLVKQWLRDTLFSSEEDARAFQVEKIATGHTPEERLAFWEGMQGWLESDYGMAWQALMQKEFGRLQNEVLGGDDKGILVANVAKLQQQQYVCGFPAEVRGRIEKYRAKAPKHD